MPLQNKQNEIERDKKIMNDAEFLWGWATPAGKIRAQRRADIIVNILKSRNVSKVLEIGGGTGVFTRLFCKAGINVKSIDISWDLIKKNRDTCLNSSNLNVNVSDVEFLSFKDNTFDAVVGICVLHHINLAPAFKEIKRVLKKNGIIIFSEPNMMNPQLIIQKNIKIIKRISILGETENETAFFRWQMKNLLENAGFREVVVNPFDFLHPWTPRLLIPFIAKLGYLFEKTLLLREISGSLLLSAIK